MKVTIKREPMSPNLEKYREKFGHPPSPEAMKFKTTQELEDLAEIALLRNKPVKSWAERP